MRQVQLPTEFVGLQSKVNYVQQWTRDEYSSSCPQCGGVPHKNGEFPDRFRLFLNASGKNKIMGWCRHCGYVWFPDNDKPVSKEEFERWRREQVIREEERKAEAERAIALLKSERVWEYYHANVVKYEFAQATLASWGIAQEHADAWKLGFIPDYTVHSKQNGEYHSPAITIPLWQPDWELRNVKVRVLNPKSSADRYRKLYKTGDDGAFWTNPMLKTDVCLMVEGEKKAMVGYAHVPEGVQVVGLPSKTPSKTTLAQFASFKKIYLCLDPDARQDGSINKAVQELGKFRTYVINLPGKVDDMIVHNSLDIIDAMRYAKRII